MFHSYRFQMAEAEHKIRCFRFKLKQDGKTRAEYARPVDFIHEERSQLTECANLNMIFETFPAQD